VSHEPASLASPHHPGHEIPGNHRPVSRGSRHVDAWPTLIDPPATGWMCRCFAVLKTRPIRLEPWQEVLVKQATEEFIRGLIDSDGCRVVANDRGVPSVRYHFSNRSDDILALFTRGAGRSWNPVDTARQARHCGVSQGCGGASRRIRRAEVVNSATSASASNALPRGTVKGCPLHVVAGLR
jgi:hypothetical protein